MLMTLSVAFVKQHVCGDLFSIADIVVGVVYNANGSNSGSQVSNEFVSPVPASPATFDLKQAVSDIRKCLGVKVPCNSEQNTTTKMFSLLN